MNIISLILTSGKEAINMSLYLLLPIMIVMFIIMGYLENKGYLFLFAKYIKPIVKPLGLNGYSILAFLQMFFVSFAAPIATLSMMNNQGTSRRTLCATLAAMMVLDQGNSSYPLSQYHLDFRLQMITSALACLFTSLVAYYIVGRNLSNRDKKVHYIFESMNERKTLLEVINTSGFHAMKVTVSAIPLLLLTILLVKILHALNVDTVLIDFLSPILHLSSTTLHLMMTKILAGGTATMNEIIEYIHHNQPVELNRYSALLINSFDLVGVAIFMTTGKRVASIMLPACLCAFIGVVFKQAINLLILSF